MISIIFLLLGFICYLVCYIKSKDIIHPLAIGGLLWFLAASLSNMTSLYDRSIQNPLSFETNLAILLAGFFFSLPVVFSGSIRKEKFEEQKLYFGSAYKLAFNFFCLLSLIAFCVRFGGVITAPSLLYGTGTDLKQSVPDALPILNFADLATPFLAVVSVWELKNSVYMTKKRCLLLLAFILFSVVVSLVYKVSRGEFLVFILGTFYLLIIPRRVIVKFKYVAIIFCFTFIFFYVGSLRISESSRVSTQFGYSGVSVLLSQVYTYIAINFQNLNLLVNSNLEPTYIWGSLKFFLKPFFSAAYDANEVGLTDYTTLFFNAKTFIYYFYNDLGIAGVILYPLIIGILLQILYNKSIVDTRFFIIIACLMKPVFFMFFGNYFFGEFVFLIPYFMVLFLTLCTRTVLVEKNMKRKESDDVIEDVQCK